MRGGHVLVADDNSDLCDVFREILGSDGHEVRTAPDSRAALLALEREVFDVMVSDIQMPGPSGLDLLREVRRRDPHLPVVLVTGEPSLHTAISAVEHGANQYLVKPVSSEALRAAVGRGLARKREQARRREAPVAGDAILRPSRREIDGQLTQALSSLWMAYQPIVWARDGSLFGHEALVRSAERALPDPGALFSAAEELGRVKEVGRAVRALVAADLRDGVTRFLNVHPTDLADEELYRRADALTVRSRQVVLEITECAALSEVTDLSDRVRELRRLGFRIAVDDLGAGYAGLASFASLEPDVVKLDMSIVRGADQEPMKRKLIAAMTALCKDLGIVVVAEGIETKAERQVLTDLGCDLLQGFLLGRPAPLPE